MPIRDHRRANKKSAASVLTTTDRPKERRCGKLAPTVLVDSVLGGARVFSDVYADDGGITVASHSFRRRSFTAIETEREREQPDSLAHPNAVISPRRPSERTVIIRRQTGCCASRYSRYRSASNSSRRPPTICRRRSSRWSRAIKIWSVRRVLNTRCSHLTQYVRCPAHARGRSSGRPVFTMRRP